MAGMIPATLLAPNAASGPLKGAKVTKVSLPVALPLVTFELEPQAATVRAAATPAVTAHAALRRRDPPERWFPWLPECTGTSPIPWPDLSDINVTLLRRVSTAHWTQGPRFG